MPFMQMVSESSHRISDLLYQENIASYINGSRSLGVPDQYNFVTVDLYEAKDLAQVIENIINLKRITGHGFAKVKNFHRIFS